MKHFWLMIVWLTACSVQSRSDPPAPAPTATPPPTAPTPPSAPPAPPCALTPFADVAPILTKYCVNCHNSPVPMDTWAGAAPAAREIARRIGLDIGQRDHMPLNSAPQMAPTDTQKLQKWVVDGAQNVPDCAAKPKLYDLDYIETAINADLEAINSTDRPFTRYLVTAHKADERANGLDPGLPDEVQESAMNKALNSVNATGLDLFKLTPIDDAKLIWRVDLRNFGIQNQINVIDQNDKINIISTTSKGLVIQGLTKSQKPWFHFDNFINVINSPKVYYALLNIGATEADLLKAIKVDLNGQLAALQTPLFIGGNKSPIALLKNRLLVRVVGGVNNASYFWQTWDINQIVSNDKNLFQFPLLAQTGGKENFNFDASEVIYSLPNGLQAYALFDKAGNRLDAADIAIVTDNRSPITPIISTAISCHRCHSMGLIPMVDEIRDHVVANAAQFDANDVQIVKTVYHGASANNAIFTADQKTFSKATAQIGLPLKDDDPINRATDILLKDWPEARAASFLFLTLPQFEQAVNESPTAKAQIGQLLTGGTVTFQQFVAVLPQLIKDARLFQDRLGR